MHKAIYTTANRFSDISLDNYLYFSYERTVRHHTDFSLRNRLETIWCAIWLHQTVLFSITYVRGCIEKAMAAIHVSNFFHSTYFVFSSIFRHWLQASWLQGTWLQWGTQVYHIPGWPGHYCWLQHQAALLRQGIPKSIVTSLSICTLLALQQHQL